MSTSAHASSFDAVARHLPFHLNETGRANEAFLRWQTENDLAARRIVDLWTYCFIRRYFAVKFVQNPAYRAADLDLVAAE